MGITTEWLKEQGLTEEQVKAVFAERGRETKEIENKHAQEISKYADYEELKSKYEQQGKDLNALKKLDPEKLKEQINSLTEKHKNDTELMQKNYTETLKKMSVKMQIQNAHDPDLILSQLDLNKIELDDKGNIKCGLEEQYKELQSTKSFLFKSEEKTQFTGVKPVEGMETKQSQSIDPVIAGFREGAGLK